MCLGTLVAEADRRLVNLVRKVISYVPVLSTDNDDDDD